MDLSTTLSDGSSALLYQTPQGLFLEVFNTALVSADAPVEVAAGVFPWVGIGPASVPGGTTVTWEASSSNYLAQDYTAAGAAAGSPYAVAAPVASGSLAFTTDATVKPQAGASQVILPDGGKVTAQDVYTSALPVGTEAITIAKTDAAGTPVGTPYADTAVDFNLAVGVTPIGGDGAYAAAFISVPPPGTVLDIDRFDSTGHFLGQSSIPLVQTYDFQTFDAPWVVGLPDGGFVAAWTQYLFHDTRGETYLQEFDASGDPVGGQQYVGTGHVQRIEVLGGGDYVVSMQDPGQTYGVIIPPAEPQYQVVYQEQGASLGVTDPSPPTLPASTIYTSDPNYTAPDGVSTIYLTGSGQTIHANTAGDTIWSNDTGNVLYGGIGNDTFHIGRGGDWAAGGGGSDTFAFAAIPWAAGGITDFGAGDVLDLTGLMSTTSDTGTDGFADGYLKITDDGQGDAQVWADYHIPGNDGWWLVTTLDGVAPTSLQTSGDVVALGSTATGPTDVSTAAASYTAPASVKTITLTGSNQTIDASATNGVTINSNDTGNLLIGGPGNDVFHMGRGGDWVEGGGGADTFAYAATPWAAGGITDFNAAEGDKIDVSGLLAASGYTGSDPFADGYLKFTTDSAGDAQLWSDINQPGNTGWWLVATLDGVSTSSLHYSGGLIT